jgi:hypothetical protein
MMLHKAQLQKAIQLGIFAMAVCFCCALYTLVLIAPTPTPTFAVKTSISDHQVSLMVKSQEVDTLGLSISSASKFENCRQAANWTDIKPLPSLTIKANDYLIKVSIELDWFLTVACDRFRMSGWRDVGLLYKIINALI